MAVFRAQMYDDKWFNDSKKISKQWNLVINKFKLLGRIKFKKSYIKRKDSFKLYFVLCVQVTLSLNLEEGEISSYIKLFF